MSLSEEVGDVPRGCPLCLVSAQALLISAHGKRPGMFFAARGLTVARGGTLTAGTCN